MRNRIAVFLGDAPNEYPRDIIKNTYAKAGELGYDVFVFGLYGSNGDNLLYAEGEKHMLSLPDFSTYAGVIVCEDTFDIEGVEDLIDAQMEKKAKCPVVYLRRDNPQFYNVVIRGQEPMAELVRHFVRHHGARDICFMQGPMSYKDSRERYAGFEQVCREENIPITEHMVFEGDFWRDKGREAVDWFMEGRTTYPQAIICANDYMAIAVCDELKKRGVRVPEDVMVSGYDNTVEGRRYLPSITSVMVDVSQLAIKAVEIIDRVNKGIPQEKYQFVEPELRLSKSCGCGEQIYVEDWSELLEKINMQDNKMRNIVFMTTDFQGVYNENEYFQSAAYYFGNTNATKGYLCLCVDEQSDDTDQKRIEFSDKMVLKRIYHHDYHMEVCDEMFHKSEVLPARYFDTEKPGVYLVLAIHHKNKTHGYFVLEFEDDQWIDGFTQPFITCLANVIDDHEVHKQMADLEEIQKLYQIDPLTGIYNRRGFEKQLHILYNQSKRTGEYMSIVSIDMDDLKYINDNFGHTEGDFALSNLAMILQIVVGGNGVCARVGGDEYSAILVSQDREPHDSFAERFTTALAMAERNFGKPYPLKASIGLCCINDRPEATLMGCMQIADAEMYKNKKARKKAAAEGK